MERLQRMFAGAGSSLGHPPPDSPTLDSSEQVYISSLALLKMLKHGTIRDKIATFLVCSALVLSDVLAIFYRVGDLEVSSTLSSYIINEFGWLCSVFRFRMFDAFSVLDF